MTYTFSTPSRDVLESFIKDRQTVLDFEALFDAVLASGPLLHATGDIVMSAATTRAGALLADGQAVSRTTYSALFAVIGTTYGAGDGSTTFNVPDISGRVMAGKEASATRITSAVSGFSGATLGAAGGSEKHVLTLAETPAHAHGGATSSDGAHTHTYGKPDVMTSGSSPNSINAGAFVSDTTSSDGAHTHTISSAGGGGAHRNMQPTIVLNAFVVY